MARDLHSCGLLVLLLCAGLQVIYAQDGDDSTESEEEDVFEAQRAFLMVRKFAADTEILKGSNTTVTIELYNAGNRWGRQTGLEQAR